MRSFQMLAVLTLIAQIGSCASELRYARKVHKASGQEQVDLDLITFENLSDGSTVSVGAYMREKDLNFLLLSFGSVACSECNEKAVDFSSNYAKQDPLFIESPTNHFAMVGVNTDVGAARSRFLSIMSQTALIERYGYGYIKWADPSGTQLMSQLVASGEVFGVPYTVLIKREEGVLWRYNNRDHYTMADVVERVKASMRGDPSNLEQRGERKPKTAPPAVDAGSFSLLSFMTPRRFDQINVKTCGGDAKTLSAEELWNYDRVIFQITKNNCAPGSACANNRALTRDTVQRCQSQGLLKCFAMQIVTDEGELRRQCSNPLEEIRDLRGGTEFFDVFATLFNAEYSPTLDEYGGPLRLPVVDGPLVMIFRGSDGALLDFWEGDLAARGVSQEFSNTILNSTVAPILKGYRRSFFGDVVASSLAGAPASSARFSEIRASAKYTVVANMDRYCGSCLEELSHWSLPNQLNQYCRESGGFCQLLALESELARPNSAQARMDFYQEIVRDSFLPRSINVRLVLDEESFGDGYSQSFQAYFSPLMRDTWDGAYGSFIYDREGKILASFKSTGAHEDDPILGTLKNLRNLP